MIQFSPSKIVRVQVEAWLVVVFIIPILCIFSVSVSLAANEDCDRLISEKSLKNFDSKKIEEIQNRLKEIGYDPVKVDGKVGQLTIAALKAFCAQDKINTTDDLVGGVIAALLNPEVKPETSRNDIITDSIVSYKLTENSLNELERRGKNINKLRELQNTVYADENSFMTAVKSKISDLTKDDKALIERYVERPKIYRLTQQTFDKIKDKNIPDSILSRLQGLKDINYASESSLRRGVMAAIRSSDDQSLSPPLKGTEKSSETNLDDKALDDLKKNNVPDDIIEQISKLKKSDYYPSIKEFEAAVDIKNKEVAKQYNGYLPMIAAEAVERNTYQLDDQSFKELQGQGVPDDVLKKLQGIQNKPYAGKDKVKAAVDPIIRAETAKYLPLILEHSRFFIITERLSGSSFKELKIENVPEDILKELQTLKSSWYFNNWYFNKKKFKRELKKIIRTRTDHYILLVAVYAKETKAYRLTDNSFANLKKKSVPAHILSWLDKLKNKDYASRDALKTEAEAKIQKLVDRYKSLITDYIDKVYKSLDQTLGNLVVKEAEKIDAYELTEKSIGQLGGEIISDPTIFKKLIQLQDIEYANKTQFINSVEKKVRVTEKDLSSILALAKQEHSFDDDKHKAVLWNSGSCGCVLEELSGVVYGFYPFWLAGPPQELNFSVLSRIGFYALSFNDNGEITIPINWDRERAGFIKKAQKYRTDVDLVIYQNNWKKWPNLAAEKKSYIFKELKTNIVKLAHIKLQDTFSKAKPFLSVGTSPVPTMSNGITIYFDGYPAKEDPDKYLFLNFIKGLSSSLKALNKDYKLNIMLDRRAIGEGVYDLESLKLIIPKKEKGANGYQDHDIVDNFLVFIEEPTKETKKILRNKVEDLFTGIQRRTMLRKIIPIITPTKFNQDQLEDDLIYFEDNFGGIGLWTLPINNGDGVDFLTCVIEIFSVPKAQTEEESTPNGKENSHAPKTEDKKDTTLTGEVNAGIMELYQKEGAKPVSSYRKFVTLHRWGGRVLFDVLLAIIMVYALLAKLFCRFRDLFRRFFWWFMGIILLFVWVFFSLLYFDPAWKNLAQGNLILLLGILVIALISVFKYIKRSRQGEIP